MESFEQSLPMMLHRTLDTVMPRYRSIFRKHNISEQQWRILRVLWESGHCSSAELARRTLLPGPSMVGIIDRMIAKGLVKRERSQQDRRVVMVSLTRKGQLLKVKLLPKADAIYKSLKNDCDDASWETMMHTLQSIINNKRGES